MRECLALCFGDFAVLLEISLVPDQNLDRVVRRECMQCAYHFLRLDEAKLVSHVVEENENVEVDELPNELTSCRAADRLCRRGS